MEKHITNSGNKTHWKYLYIPASVFAFKKRGGKNLTLKRRQ